MAIRTPISHAIKHLPKWWRDLPVKEYEVNRFIPKKNMKRCVGFLDYYKKSIALPLWSDIFIDVNDKGYNWQYADGHSEAEVHPADQYGEWLPLKDYGHIKLVSPWLIKTKEKNISWVWSQPTYAFDNPEKLVIPPGVLNFYYNSGSHINCMLDRRKKGVIELLAGQPMAFMTPMSDRKVDIKIHVISKEESIKKHFYPISFTGSYQKTKKLIDEQQCPFNFRRK
jgi:hypothetical protein